jgi:hypothetical protein
VPDVAPLAVYGPLGVFMAFGLWFVIWTFNRQTKAHSDEIRRLVAELNEERSYSHGLEDRLRDQIIPLLTTTQQATADAVRLIVQQTALLEDRDRRRRDG